jgi:hypothetical protein
MKTTHPQEPRLLNNAVPLDSDQLLQMTVKGHQYHVRPCIGFAGYFVSTCGAVFSCVGAYNGQRQRIVRDQPKLLRPSDNGNGYLLVRLYTGNGHSKRIYVHRLVATNLLKRPNFEAGINYQVNHINQKRNDNRACNLEWTTPETNMLWNSVMKQVQEEAQYA